jgi:predicted nucleic acid-binding protein
VDRLFLDANVLFSAAYREGSPLRRLWHRPDAELVTSGYAVLEAERNLQGEQKARLGELLKGVRIVGEPPERPLPGRVVLRAKDVPILAAAVAARATHLITGDRRDFGAYFGKKLTGVRVVTPRDYLNAAKRRR